MKEIFPIVPAARGPIIVFGISTVALLGILYLAAGAPVIVFGIVGIVFCSIILLLGSFIYASRHVKFEVSPEGLAIRGDLYGRRLPAAALLTAEAQVVDLTASPSHRPVLRTNGAGFPGYGSGWFQLANGEKALIFVTDKQRVVYLPTRQGYVILLSVAEPEKFLQALRQMAGPQPQ